MVAAVRVLEEHDGRPVVGHILGEAARRAGGGAGHVVRLRVHGGVEGVASDDLVQMGRVEHAGVDQGVGTLDDQLRAGESEHVELSGGVGREERGASEGGPLLHHHDGERESSSVKNDADLLCVLLRPCDESG